jgi:hypothetical protein
MKKLIRLGLFIVIVGLALVFYFLNPVEHEIFPKCAFHSLTGYYCPGCGSQRAIHSLLHLDFTGVVSNNFLFLPAMILLMYHYSHPYLNRWFVWKLPNIFYFKRLPWIIFGVVILFWILRNLPSYPFTVLAPN